MAASSALRQQVIIPSMRFRDARRMIDWICAAYGFEVGQVHPPEGERVAHVELIFDGNMIMAGSVPEPDETERLQVEAGPAYVYVVLPDDAAVDAHCERARAAGAEILREPVDADYGGRGYSSRDPEGNVWSFGSYRPLLPS